MRPNNTDLFWAVALVACLSFSACTTGEVELLESLPLEVYAEIKSPATATKVDTDAHANDYDKSVFVDDDEISIF